MQKYLDFVREFHENNENGIAFVSNQLKKHLLENPENQTEIETILDFLYSNPKTDISKIGYATILAKTDKWHKKLKSVAIKNDETEWIDYEVVKDFGDGFRFVKLISKSCYEREGKLMSHCVASYFGRSSEIYSLRDSKNAPHCTIENGVQIKGKWNGKIDPKYVDYVVKFLEHIGMTVGENEMKNLGYYKLETIEKGLTCEKTYNGYVYENDLSSVKDSEGDVYNWLGIFNVKSMFDLDVDLNFKFAFDFTGMVKYFVKKIHSEWNYAQNASSWNYAKNASSWDYAVNADIGKNSIAKAKIWSWIVLAEYDPENKPIAVVAKQVDGKEILEDTWYTLKDGVFTVTKP